MWTAFIVYSHSLFARGLQTLLQAQDGVIVAGVESRGSEALEHIKALKPDVVIVEAVQKEFEPEKLLCGFLQTQNRATMVRLNLDDNTAILYSGLRCKADSVEDLIACVLKSFVSDH